MAESLNSEVELVIPASSFHGLATYGSLMLGNAACEFYNERNVRDFIQIPWEEVHHVDASVLFGGRVIPRFAIFTHNNGSFTFSTRDNKQVLRVIRAHIGAEKMLRSLSFFDVLRASGRGILRIFSKK